MRTKALHLQSWNWLAILGILLMFWYLTLPVLGWDLGGFISQKLIDRNGTSNSYLVVESSAANSNPEIGMGTILSTSPATNVTYAGGVTTATLHGNLTNLNGFPQGTGWFEWGYAGAFDHTTVSQTLVGLGDFSVVLNGWDKNKVVNYRAVIRTDGTSYGASQLFEIGSQGTSTTLLLWILPVLWTVGLVIALFKTKNLYILLIGVFLLVMLIFFVLALQGL